MRILIGLVSILSMWLAAAPALAANELVTDKVVIENRTPRPMFGSGMFHVLVRVDGVTMSGEKRDYYITYFGEDQPLPEVGGTCDITYRNEAISGLVIEPLPRALPAVARYVRRFDCIGPDITYDEHEFLNRDP